MSCIRMRHSKPAGWPFALAVNDEQLSATVNGALYQASTPASSLNAPADLEFAWSDGHAEVSKKISLRSLLRGTRRGTSVKQNGQPVTAGLAWLGGFGDLTVKDPAPIETVSYFSNENRKLTTIAARKLEGPEKWA